MKKRHANKTFSNIGDVIETVMHQCRPMTDAALIRVWDVWDAAVSKDIATNARPAAFKGDILLVYVSNSNWLHHLRFLENDLKVKLNKALGGDKIKHIRYKIGPI